MTNKLVKSLNTALSKAPLGGYTKQRQNIAAVPEETLMLM